MIERRTFLQQSALLLGGLAAPGYLYSKGLKNKKYHYPPGLQLYTIRDAMAKDPRGSLKRVGEIGYKVVEHATYSGTEDFYGMSVSEIGTVLKEAGLQMKSGHYALGNAKMKGTILGGDWEKAVADAETAGLEFMVCPFLMEDERKTPDDFKKRAAEFNRAGEVCKKAGIQFCYHNHNFEFQRMDGQLPFDILLQETDKELVKFEMDIFWVSRAGLNPVKLMEENPKRFVLWHVKDMAKTGDGGTTDLMKGAKAITEVGHGVIDWPEIFKNAKESGLKYFFVEQDFTSGDPFVSIRESLQYLDKNILA